MLLIERECVLMMHNEFTIFDLHGLPSDRRLTDTVQFVHKKLSGFRQ